MGRPKKDRETVRIGKIWQTKTTEGKPGRWRGHVVDLDGVRHTRTGVTEEACYQRLEALKRDIEGGVVAKGTVRSWVDGQIHVAKANGEPPRPSTVEFRQYLASLIPDTLANTKIEKVDKAAVDAALDFIEHGHQTGRAVSRTTVGRVRALMVQAWQDALDNDAARINAPERTRPRTSESKEPRWLDVAQSRRLLAKLSGHPWRALYIVLATVGLRRSEVLGMRWDDIDMDAGVLRVRWTLVKLLSGEMVLKPVVKSKSSRRTIPLPPYAADAIREHHAQFGEVSEFVWSQTATRLRRAGQTAATPKGLPHPDSLRGPLARACKAAGVPHVTPHQLRHSAATIALAAGATERAIMDLLGHSDPRTAAHYQHVLDAVREGTRDKLDAAWGPLPDGGGTDADGDEEAA